MGLVGAPFVLDAAAVRRRSIHVAFVGAAVVVAAVLGAGLVTYLPFDAV
jgi:hypothetical protein